jgi:hypothetical protein
LGLSLIRVLTRDRSRARARARTRMRARACACVFLDTQPAYAEMLQFFFFEYKHRQARASSSTASFKDTHSHMLEKVLTERKGLVAPAACDRGVSASSGGGRSPVPLTIFTTRFTTLFPSLFTALTDAPVPCTGCRSQAVAADCPCSRASDEFECALQLPQLRQYLHFCTSKANKVVHGMNSNAPCSSPSRVSICTFVPVMRPATCITYI